MAGTTVRSIDARIRQTLSAFRFGLCTGVTGAFSGPCIGGAETAGFDASAGTDSGFA